MAENTHKKMWLKEKLWKLCEWLLSSAKIVPLKVAPILSVPFA